MAKPNQGYRRDLDLQETPNDFTALDNLGGTGISFDLQIIQNNLRNISTAGFSTLTDGFFDFGTESTFVFTNDDPLTFEKTVSFGATTFNTTDTFFVCNSDGERKFKLSTTSSTSSTGINTISITGTASTNSFNFIRSDAVSQENVLNLVDPVSLQDADFSTIRNITDPKINNSFDEVQERIENAKFKRPVLPGDILILKLELISPIRRGISHMMARAYVNDELVTEAEMKAKIIKK